MGKKFQILRPAVLIAIATILSCACDCNHRHPEDDGEYSKVLLVYSAGANNLWDSLLDNIMELKKGYVPTKNSKEVLLVLSHLPEAAYGPSYSFDGSRTSPYLFRIYKDNGGKCVLDTLLTMTKGSMMTDPAVLQSALEYTSKNFPAESYGMIYSSHGTGWLPVGYYDDPGKYEKTIAPMSAANGSRPYVVDHSGFTEAYHRKVYPDEPEVKSIGAEVSGTKWFETEIKDFFSHIPMKLDYIVFDACLMGGVEVAYQARNVCKYLVFSPAEILSSGMTYNTMAGNLLYQSKPDVVQVAKDYYEKYRNKSSVIYRSATVTVVDCTKMDALVSVCSSLSNKYRSAFQSMDRSKVQQFFRDNHYWFYDLKDIFEKCNMTAEEKNQLDAALSECIVYKIATDGFLYDPTPGKKSSGFPINAYCGLSMYLPIESSAYLNAYYQTLDWNKAVKLVE